MATKKPAKPRPYRVKLDRYGSAVCRVCACTESHACEPPCAWVEADLCSLCALAVEAVREWETGAHRPNVSALLREVRASAMREAGGGARVGV